MGLAPWSAALDSDRDQPIQIVADIAIRDEMAGETRYEGNVVLTQGSLRITADTLSIRHNADEADMIVATGRPATLVQQPTSDQAPVDASALRIESNRLPVRMCMLMTRLPYWHVALFLHLGPCEQSGLAYSAAQASLTDSASVLT